jgi:predicted N-acyltransferase
VIKDGVFYGRYWGCLPEHDVKNLHFEVCYWSAIEYCIEHGLDRLEPGAGGGGTDVGVVPVFRVGHIVSTGISQ